MAASFGEMFVPKAFEFVARITEDTAAAGCCFVRNWGSMPNFTQYILRKLCFGRSIYSDPEYR
jgi:hypothetical protein